MIPEVEGGIKFMTDINNVVLVGNLTRDLGSDERSFGYTNGGTCRANVSIAVNRLVKKNDQWTDETSFFDIVIWGKTAENLKPYLVKGQKIIVQGSLKQERWEKDGKSNSRVVVNAETIQLVGSKKEGAKGESTASATNTPATEESTGMDFPEDVPF